MGRPLPEPCEVFFPSKYCLYHYACARQVTKACKEFGGFYLGSIGGPAAILAQNCIKKVEVKEYPELGMEAVWQIDVGSQHFFSKRRVWSDIKQPSLCLTLACADMLARFLALLCRSKTSLPLLSLMTRGMTFSKSGKSNCQLALLARCLTNNSASPNHTYIK